MSRDTCFRVFIVAAITCTVAIIPATPAASQMAQHSSTPAADSLAQAQLTRIIADAFFSDSSPHMRMASTRVATVADSARAAALVVTARAALSRYVDVKLAESDGYFRNAPWLKDQPIYHYNSMRNFTAAGRGEFDVTKPVSLLYKKDDHGALRLVGAMYATGAPEAGLDAMLPVSMAHWHEHVNFCYPGRDANTVTMQKGIGAATVFLTELYFNITSASSCEAAGGHFVPVEFGWMAHVYMFADDPKAIWDADEIGNVEMHMQHP